MKLWRRIQRIIHSKQYEADLAEEIRSHREAAGPAFGSTAIAMEDARAVWRFAWLDSLMQDVRYALRGFRRSPGFAFTVIGTLALGLGILATAFSVFSAMVLRPFAVRDPYSLYTFYWQAKNYTHTPSTWREFQDVRKLKTIFVDALAAHSTRVAVGGRAAYVEVVSGNYFNMLGARICQGRPIVESDDDPNGPPIAVASYDAWKSRLNADPNVVGRKLYMRGHPVEIAGVACPEFNGLQETGIDFWVPLSLSGVLVNGADLFGAGQPPRLGVIGRLRPGMTPERAKIGLLAYGKQISATWTKGQTPERVEMFQRATVAPISRQAMSGFLPVFLAFGLILLIACANVSNMMLARALARQREIGIRISLGAGRLRMIRQLLTESLILALPAALAAFAVAWVTIAGALWLVYHTLPTDVGPGRIDVAPDWRVLWFLLAAAGAATLVFGLMPAIQATRSSLVQANRGEFANGYRPSRLRDSLVVVQVTVCSLLLISAAVALRSERVAASQDPGLDAHGVYIIGVAEKFRAAALARLSSLPAAVSMGVSWIPQVSRGGRRSSMSGLAANIATSYDLVSPEYFKILGVPMLRGRNFTTEEADAEAAVAIVSETAARRLWPNQEAVGQTLSLPWVITTAGDDRVPAFRTAIVVGVAQDVICDWDEHGPNRTGAYFPTGPKTKHASAILLRMRGDPNAARRAIEAALDQAAPGGADETVSLEQMLDMQMYPYRALFSVTGFMGALALLLTVSGVYGVLSYLVNQRRREFGIRMALGAEGRSVAGMVFRQSIRLASIGAVLGAFAALGVAKLIAHSMQPINVFDAGGYAGGSLLVIAAAMGATWVPARRAVRVDPVVTLRCD